MCVYVLLVTYVKVWFISDLFISLLLSVPLSLHKSEVQVDLEKAAEFEKVVLAAAGLVSRNWLRLFVCMFLSFIFF